MSEENVIQSEIVDSVEQEVDYKSLYEKAQQDLVAVAAKKDELLRETKKAKADREEATYAARKAAEDKAAKDGEFEKLWNTAKAEKDELNKKLNDLSQGNRREKIQVAAMRLANDLADGDNAELLSDFVSRSLDKMADDTGALGSEVLEAVKNDFKTNQKYKSLLRSSKASGGSAPGNLSSAQQVTKVDRNTFDAMSPGKKMDFIRSQGTVVDSL